MLLDPVECTLCMLESRIREIYRFTRDVSAIRTFFRMLSEIEDFSRTRMFTESFNYVTKIVKIDDPHRDDKASLTSLFKSVSADLERYDVVKLIEIAAAANGVDVPMRDYHHEPVEIVRSLLDVCTWIGVTVDELMSMINRALRIVYLLDNAGEHVIDMMLIKRLAGMGKEVFIVVKERPYEVDVTYYDVADELRGSGVLVKTRLNIPFFLTDIPRTLCDDDTLVISKGTANLEAYLESSLSTRCVFLLKVKCKPMSALLGAPKGRAVITDSRYVDKLRHEIRD